MGSVFCPQARKQLHQLDGWHLSCKYCLGFGIRVMFWDWFGWLISYIWMNLYILTIRCQTVTRPPASQASFPPSPSYAGVGLLFLFQLWLDLHLKVRELPIAMDYCCPAIQAMLGCSWPALSGDTPTYSGSKVPCSFLSLDTLWGPTGGLFRFASWPGVWVISLVNG